MQTQTPPDLIEARDDVVGVVIISAVERGDEAHLRRVLEHNGMLDQLDRLLGQIRRQHIDQARNLLIEVDGLLTVLRLSRRSDNSTQSRKGQMRVVDAKMREARKHLEALGHEDGDDLLDPLDGFLGGDRLQHRRHKRLFARLLTRFWDTYYGRSFSH